MSLEPPLVSVCVAHTSSTWPALRDAHAFGVSVLAEDQQDACRRLAERGVDRFAHLSWRAAASGAVLIDGSAAWLECTAEAEHRAGDHDIVVLRVTDLDVDGAVCPLVFHTSRFRKLER